MGRISSCVQHSNQCVDMAPIASHLAREATQIGVHVIVGRCLRGCRQRGQAPLRCGGLLAHSWWKLHAGAVKSPALWFKLKTAGCDSSTFIGRQ